MELSDAVNAKLAPRGAGAAAMAASGEADLVVLPLSELLAEPGIESAGILPAEIQLDQTFSAAIVAGSKQQNAAKRLIDFLTTARSAEAIRKSGMELPRKP